MHSYFTVKHLGCDDKKPGMLSLDRCHHRAYFVVEQWRPGIAASNFKSLNLSNMFTGIVETLGSNDTFSSFSPALTSEAAFLFDPKPLLKTPSTNPSS